MPEHTTLTAGDIDAVVDGLLSSDRHDPGRDVVVAAIIRNLRDALGDLLHEVIEAGFETARDYNWPGAIAGARAALGNPDAR